MATPSYTQWRSLRPGLGLPAHSIRERLLAALATFITGTNPDGTPRGS